MVSDTNLSSTLQTTLAVGGALALVAGVVIHRNKDKLSSILVENITTEEMSQDTDWQNLTIPAQVCRPLILIIVLMNLKTLSQKKSTIVFSYLLFNFLKIFVKILSLLSKNYYFSFFRPTNRLPD